LGNKGDDNDAFIRLIAHDLRTPLTALQLNAQLIERTAIADGRDKDVRWSRLIASSARKMEHMIQLLVDAERLRAGRIELARERIAFAGWLEDWLAGAAPRGGLPRLKVVATDRSVVVLADARRLQQALLALVEVAVRSFDEEAPISIEVGRTAAGLSCSFLGPRLEMAAADKLSQLTAGHDIEMHYVKAVLEAHGGSLSFVGSDAVAMGFEVTLPIT